MTWSEPAEVDEERWNRLPGEPSKAYGAFRVFRDLSVARRSLGEVSDQVGVSESRVRAWAGRWEWRDRADAWDDACHQLEDRERLEAIRAMHAVHRDAGRAAVDKAIEALGRLRADSLLSRPSVIVRLLESGAKLERATLVTSVEEMQGVEMVADEEEDAWERIARELDTDAGGG